MSLKYQHFGEGAILVSWPNKIDKETRLDIHHFNQKIQHLIPQLIAETVTAYCSLTIYITCGTDKEILISKLKEIYLSDVTQQEINSTLWQVPVCYDLSFAIDLKNLSAQKKLSINEIVEYHSNPTYTVDFFGFLPGFPYLSGLNPLLCTPRLDSPRASVAKGSVAIGGNQTGVYPVNSPGGWHIIGRTPLSFFDASKSPPCFIQPLDKIKFYSISLEEFYHD
ncbi:MAG: 5-oxoprolinase subunit PxpB [Proteobacteria bacterium]|nr:5-oxoprolinase subunit PxpB [Pseudomonadota bacterium]